MSFQIEEDDFPSLYKIHTGSSALDSDNDSSVSEGELKTLEKYKPPLYTYKEIQANKVVIEAKPKTNSWEKQPQISKIGNNANTSSKSISSTSINTKTLPDIVAEKLTTLVLPHFCKICNKNLQTPSSAQCHYKSKKHTNNILQWHNAEEQRLAAQLVEGRISGLQSKIVQSINVGEAVKANNSEHCEICGITLNGMWIDMHYKSDNHQKNAKNYCVLCKVKSTSKQDLSLHMKGSKHLNKMRESNQSDNIPKIPQTVTMSGGFKTSTSLIKTDSNSTNSLNDYIVPFNPTWPQDLRPLMVPTACFICNVKLTSFNDAKDHYKSAKHEISVNKWLKEKNNSVPLHWCYCDVCDKCLDGTKMAESHYRESSHIIKTISFYCHICKAKFISKTELDQHCQSFPHTRIANFKSLLIQKGISSKEFWLQQGLALQCLVCDDSTLWRESDAPSHFLSQRHSQQLDAWMTWQVKDTKKSDGYRRWHFCDLCNVPLDGTTNIEFHYRGETHLNNHERMLANSRSLPVNKEEITPQNTKGNQNNVLLAAITKPTLFDICDKKHDECFLRKQVLSELEKFVQAIYFSDNVPLETALTHLKRYNKEIDNLKTLNENDSQPKTEATVLSKAEKIKDLIVGKKSEVIKVKSNKNSDIKNNVNENNCKVSDWESVKVKEKNECKISSDKNGDILKMEKLAKKTIVKNKSEKMTRGIQEIDVKDIVNNQEFVKQEELLHNKTTTTKDKNDIKQDSYRSLPNLDTIMINSKEVNKKEPPDGKLFTKNMVENNIDLQHSDLEENYKKLMAKINSSVPETTENALEREVVDELKKLVESVYNSEDLPLDVALVCLQNFNKELEPFEINGGGDDTVEGETHSKKIDVTKNYLNGGEETGKCKNLYGESVKGNGELKNGLANDKGLSKDELSKNLDKYVNQAEQKECLKVIESDEVKSLKKSRKRKKKKKLEDILDKGFSDLHFQESTDTDKFEEFLHKANFEEEFVPIVETRSSFLQSEVDIKSQTIEEMPKRSVVTSPDKTGEELKIDDNFQEINVPTQEDLLIAKEMEQAGSVKVNKDLVSEKTWIWKTSTDNQEENLTRPDVQTEEESYKQPNDHFTQECEKVQEGVQTEGAKVSKMKRQTIKKHIDKFENLVDKWEKGIITVAEEKWFKSEIIYINCVGLARGMDEKVLCHQIIDDIKKRKFEEMKKCLAIDEHLCMYNYYSGIDCNNFIDFVQEFLGGMPNELLMKNVIKSSHEFKEDHTCGEQFEEIEHSLNFYPAEKKMTQKTGEITDFGGDCDEAFSKFEELPDKEKKNTNLGVIVLKWKEDFAHEKTPKEMNYHRSFNDEEIKNLCVNEKDSKVAEAELADSPKKYMKLEKNKQNKGENVDDIEDFHDDSLDLDFQKDSNMVEKYLRKNNESILYGSPGKEKSNFAEDFMKYNVQADNSTNNRLKYDDWAKYLDKTSKEMEERDSLEENDASLDYTNFTEQDAANLSSFTDSVLQDTTDNFSNEQVKTTNDCKVL